MKVLLATNFAPVEQFERNNKKMVTEGWVTALRDSLLSSGTIELTVLYPQNESKQPMTCKINSNFTLLGYYVSDENSKEQQQKVEKQVEDLLSDYVVDIIHIMGTEMPHSYSIWKACKSLGYENKVVVSIQGLISKCSEMYDYGVPMVHKLGLTICDVYKGFNSIYRQKKVFYKRGKYETDLLSECHSVIGRTDWDRRCCISLNQSIKYYHCGEILRSVFYDGEVWNGNSCKKHSIFISQGSYSLKGLHHFIKAFPIILNRYPDATVTVGGLSPVHKNPIKRDAYGYYINKLIRYMNLSDHISFVGKLSAEEMKDQYLNANVFVSPSNLENSSNSIGEALMLGVPVVASNVGGTDNIISDGTDGLLYPLTEPYVMAEEVAEIFESTQLASVLSNNARKKANQLHNKIENCKKQIDIYREICGK